MVPRILRLRPSASAILRLAALAAVALLAVSPRLRRRLLYPGLTEEGEALPGGVGCPFFGDPGLYAMGDPSYGGGHYYRKAAAALGTALGGRVPRVWKYYFFGKPFAVVSGGKTLQKILGREFDGSLTNSGIDLMEGGLFPTDSLLFERDKQRHSYLRRLVGAALTPSAVARAAPTLRSSARHQVSLMIHGSKINNNTHGEIEFHEICTDYTLDVAWRQILGLELAHEEIPVFKEKVATWIKGIFSLRATCGIAVRSTPGYSAREYLISKIEERIDQLLEEGPDHKSTLSGMVFAEDDDDGNSNSDENTPGKKLSRREIVDNALMLIFAGSETSAGTLTNAMLFLGLHPAVWDRLVEEQRSIQEIHGDAMTISSIDANRAPYLDAVLKETMRLRPFVGMIPRAVLEDIDVDGDGQTIIPKGFLIDPSMLLTHEYDPSCVLPGGMHLDAIQGFRPERWLGNSSTSTTINSTNIKNNNGGGGGEEYTKPHPDWYLPYGSGPRYCLGKNLAQLEMKIFLATVARELGFPRLSMLPEGYDYSPNKKLPDSEDYFAVKWGTEYAVVPTASDGVLASVTSAAAATPSPAAVQLRGGEDDEDDGELYPIPVVRIPRHDGVTNSTTRAALKG